jgi:hypothetical protein
MSGVVDRTHLLIPIHVDALMVGGNESHSAHSPLKKGTVSAAPNYSLLKDRYLIGADLRQPLEPLDPPLEPGIHLHFRLPAAVAHWDQKNEPGFPRIPNRWLVQRFYKAESDGQRMKAWIIRGDEQALATEPAVVLPVPHKAAPGKEYETPLELRRIGWAQVIWDGDKREGDYVYSNDNAKAEVELTAVTGGDAGFSAHYPACRSILGLHDNLKDVPKEVELSYLVTGWYSGAEDDPWSGLVARLERVAKERSALAATLATADAAKKKDIERQLSELKKASEILDEWMKDRGCVRDFGKIDELGGAELARALPAGILCHGTVKNVRRKSDGDFFENFEKPENYWVDLGNTSAEAFAARVANERNNAKKRKHLVSEVNLLEDLITALQVGLFSQGAKAAEMDAELHRQGFAAVAGGKTWVIQQAAAAAPESVQPSRLEALPPLSADLQKKLDELNELERECDRRERLLKDYRWELYALWHRTYRKKPPNPLLLNRERLQKFVEVYKTRVEEAKNSRDKRVRGKGSLGEELEGRSKAPSRVQYNLEEQPAAPFYVPKDPVLLLTGPAAGALGTREKPKSVKVRITGEELKKFSYTVKHDSDSHWLEADDWLKTLKISPEYLKAIPPWSARLLKETLLLDELETTGAHQLPNGKFGQYKTTDPELLPEEGSYGKYKTTKDTDGVPPDTFSRFSWKHNPWIPLYLYWAVGWQADEVSGELTKRWTLEHVAKDAPYGRNTDLIPLKDDKPEDEEDKPEYTGLCFVGSPLFDLQYDRTEASGTGPLRKLMEQIDECLGSRTVMISQALGGFHDALIMRRAGDQLPPLDYDKWNDTDKKHPLYLDPISKVLGKDFQPDSSPVTPGGGKMPFCPLRTGLLQLKELVIIDAFGQKTRVEPEKVSKKPRESPGLCQSGRLEVGLPSPKNPTAVRLHPRFCRPMRLEFTGVSGEDTDAGAGPVCGWVVLNRFDQNLVLYAANGLPAGILQMRFDEKAETLFYWVAVPGASGDEADHEDVQDGHLRDLEKVKGIQDRHLRAFAAFVLALKYAEGHRFAERISKAVEATEERVPEDNPLISVLIGRPLALVRAKLRLEMGGLPALDQEKSWRADPKSGSPSLDEFLKTALTNGSGDLPKQSMHTGGVERVRWRVRLGDSRSTNDGLVGFFKGDSVSGPFYASWGFDFGKGTDPYKGLQRDQDLELDCDNPLHVTLLMDPQARVHVTSGVLPKGYLELSAAQLIGAKQIREVFFQTAPVLGTPATPHVPKPSDDYGQWSWAYRPNVSGWAEDPEMVSAADLAGPAVGWPTLTEGWLKLKLEPVLIRSLWMKAPVERPQKGTNVTLAWTLHGADSVKLFKLRLDGTEEAPPVSEWSRPSGELGDKWSTEAPPTKVQADTTFRLRAYNQSGYEDYKDIKILTEE